MEFSKQEKVSEIRYKVHFRKYVKNGPTFQGCAVLVPTLSFIKMAQGKWLNGTFFSFGSPYIFSRCVNNGSLYLPPVLRAWYALKCVQFSFNISVGQGHLIWVVSHVCERRLKH